MLRLTRRLIDLERERYHSWEYPGLPIPALEVLGSSANAVALRVPCVLHFHVFDRSCPLSVDAIARAPFLPAEPAITWRGDVVATGSDPAIAHGQ